MGRAALVTGAAQGLGRAFAQRLAADGATVLCVDLADTGVTVSAIRNAGGSAHGLVGDVSSAADVDRIHREAVGLVGDVAVLVNNAGIYPFAPFESIAFSQWKRVMSVNADSVFLMCQAFAPSMRSAGWGRIVNMASDTLRIVIPDLSHYTASKGAVVGLTRALATEFGRDGVTVNAIAPGVVRTEGTVGPSQEEPQSFASFAERCAIPRVAEPHDVAGLLTFLVSEEAAFITGQTLWLDGGLVRG